MKRFLVLVSFFTIWSALYAQEFIEYDYELDIYYSNVSAFIDLDSANEITDASNQDETEIYTNLVLNTFNPNIFLVEAAVHPMPILGLYFRENHEDYYDRSKMQDFNIIKAVTAGFEEPSSLSLFFGRMMIFKNRDEEHVGKNRAYMGYLLTVGDYSIKDNRAHRDRWMNFEFKLKGTREQKNRDLDWSFRVGARIHENKDFVNTVFVGARRSSTDYKKSAWSLVYNSAFSTMMEVSADTFDLAAAEAVVEKKFPLSWTDKMAFGLGIGYLYNSGSKYRGALKEEGIDNHQLIFRPNLEF